MLGPGRSPYPHAPLDTLAIQTKSALCCALAACAPPGSLWAVDAWLRVPGRLAVVRRAAEGPERLQPLPVGSSGPEAPRSGAGRAAARPTPPWARARAPSEEQRKGLSPLEIDGHASAAAAHESEMSRRAHGPQPRGDASLIDATPARTHPHAGVRINTSMITPLEFEIVDLRQGVRQGQVRVYCEGSAR